MYIHTVVIKKLYRHHYRDVRRLFAKGRYCKDSIANFENEHFDSWHGATLICEVHLWVIICKFAPLISVNCIGMS